MDLLSNIDEGLINWFIIPLLIFIARILDVSIGTVRIVLISKGIKGLASLTGFFEALVWVVAISQIIQNINNFVNFFAYAGGYAMGTYVGLLIENKLSLGKVVIRIITRRDATDLITHLTKENYNLTTLDAQGRFGDVKIIFMVLNRKEIPNIIKIINDYNPRAFYTIEDMRFVNDLDSIKKINPIFMKFSNIRKVFTPRK